MGGVVEQLDDLLDPSKKDLKMFESKDHGTTVPDLTEITVSTSEEVHHLIERGVANQHIGATSTAIFFSSAVSHTTQQSPLSPSSTLFPTTLQTNRIHK